MRLFCLSIILTVSFFASFAPRVASAEQPVVTAYITLDREFAEPILAEFEKQTGITVQPVFDAEASKTVGLVNRMIAEKDRPLCDVFWNSELLQTLRLKSQGMLEPYQSKTGADLPAQFRDPQGYWYGFAARARVIIYNKEKIKETDVPRSLLDWGKSPALKGQFAISDPHFGASSPPLAALIALLGKDKATLMIDQWKAGDVAVLGGNAAVRNEVAAGRYAFGITDTDDAFGALDEGKPVGMIFPKEGLLIPNSVALVKNGPHPVEGKKLIDFLLRKDTEKALAASGSVQIPLRADVPRPKRNPTLAEVNNMPVEWNQLLANLPGANELADRLQAK